MTPSLRKQLSDDHRRASEMMAYALHANCIEIWSRTHLFWRKRLTGRENVILAYNMLRALDQDHAVHVIQTVFDAPNMPMVPLFSAMNEAAHWADWADYDSVKACTLAGYNRMSPADQIEFLRHVTSRNAA